MAVWKLAVEDTSAQQYGTVWKHAVAASVRATVWRYGVALKQRRHSVRYGTVWKTRFSAMLVAKAASALDSAVCYAGADVRSAFNFRPDRRCAEFP